MNTIAVVDAGKASGAFYREYFARLRRETGAEAIVVIMDGDVDREGTLVAIDKYDRSEMLLEAGASAVVEMPLCSLLLADNVYAFAVTAMLQKLDCAQQIAIPYVGGSEALFEKITGFLFDEPPAYQKKMRQLRAQGAELRKVLSDVMEQFVPGAGEFLQIGMNRMAVEQYNTLRRAYFPAKPHMVRLDAVPDVAQPSLEQDARLLRKLKDMLLSMDDGDAVRWMQNMYYGNDRVDARVLELLRTGDAKGFVELSERAERPGEPAVAIRWHLLGCLAGYRKVDSFVCIIYNYIPYIRLLGAANGFRDVLEQKVGTTLLIDTPQEKDFSLLNDEAKQLLTQIDDRARDL